MPKRLLRFWPCAVILLIALLGLNEMLSLGIGPVWILLGAVCLPFLVMALVKYPAAFLVPLLFISRGMEMPNTPLSRAIDMDALTFGTILLCLAVGFRLLRLGVGRQTESLRDYFKGQGKGIAAFLLFAAVVTISYTYTRSPGYGGDKLLSFLIVGGLMFFAPFVLMTDDRDIRHFAFFSVIFGMAQGLSRVAVAAHGVYGVHENPTSVGVGQLVGMAILIVLNFKMFEKKWAQNLLLLSLPVLAAGLIAAETRDALFSLMLVLLGMAFARRRPMSLISPLTTLGGIAVILVVLLVLPEHLFKGDAAAKFRFKTLEVVAMARGQSTDEGSGGRRLVFYHAALEGFEEKPLVGHGVGGWADYYWHNDEWEYPHDIYLEILVEEGLLGFVPFLALLVIALKAAKKAFNEASGRFAFVLPCLVYCMFLITASGDIDDSRFLWLWCSIAFVACRIIESTRQGEAQPDAVGVS
jgi:O-antigen ligase